MPPDRGQTAATERDPWRERLLVAEVHDENAAALGGMSAHAGLFSTASDMARFAQLWLSEGVIAGEGGRERALKRLTCFAQHIEQNQVASGQAT